MELMEAVLQLVRAHPQSSSLAAGGKGGVEHSCGFPRFDNQYTVYYCTTGMDASEGTIAITTRKPVGHVKTSAA